MKFKDVEGNKMDTSVNMTHMSEQALIKQNASTSTLDNKKDDLLSPVIRKPLKQA